MVLVFLATMGVSNFLLVLVVHRQLVVVGLFPFSILGYNTLFVVRL